MASEKEYELEDVPAVSVEPGKIDETFRSNCIGKCWSYFMGEKLHILYRCHKKLQETAFDSENMKKKIQ